MLAEYSVPKKPLRFRVTLEMFEALSDAGHFHEPVELLNGEILVKGLQSPEHAYVIQQLSRELQIQLQGLCVIRPQLPLVLESPPPDFVMPDLALLKLPSENYKTRSATSSDAVLVVEVSNSTLDYDQSDKLQAYARNMIPVYWIVHLQTQELEVCTEPNGDTYTFRRRLNVGQPVEIWGQTLKWW
jgi:Uma2 family endonuclease